MLGANDDKVILPARRSLFEQQLRFPIPRLELCILKKKPFCHYTTDHITCSLAESEAEQQQRWLEKKNTSFFALPKSDETKRNQTSLSGPETPDQFNFSKKESFSIHDHSRFHFDYRQASPSSLLATDERRILYMRNSNVLENLEQFNFSFTSI